MESPTIQERFEALRQAYIAENPVDLREDQQINDALEAWKAIECQNPHDSGACVACDESYDAEGSGNRVNPIS